mgnify:CR=1 FL=1
MALATDIADAVVTELASGAFSQSSTPERRVLPEHELADLKDLRATVVPRGVEITGASRTLSQHDVRIDIGIQKKLDKAIDTEVAQLAGLVDEIAEFLKRRPLQATPYAVWVKTVNEPIYAADHLAQQRAFTSVLSITYRVLK